MLNWAQLQAIDRQLATASALADRYAAHDSGFVDAVVDWLGALEKELANNRLPASAAVAALRTSVLAATRGTRATGLEVSGRPTRRKLGIAAAVDALARATETIDRTVEGDRQRQSGAREMVRRIAVVARAKAYAPSEPGQDVRALWHRLRDDTDTQAAALQVEGMVGSNDAILLLDQEIMHV